MCGDKGCCFTKQHEKVNRGQVMQFRNKEWLGGCWNFDLGEKLIHVMIFHKNYSVFVKTKTLYLKTTP